MIPVAIYLQEEYSQLNRRFIEKVYNPIAVAHGGEEMCVVAYWNPFVSADDLQNEIPVITSKTTKKFIETGEIGVIIVPSEYYAGQMDFLSMFFDLSISLDNIYISKDFSDYDGSEEQALDFYESYYERKKLPYLEFHIADHCNLNCADCEHYSGLVKEPVFPSFEKFAKDFRKLKEYIEEIGKIRILGGEPLLNPEVEKYIQLTHEVFPKSNIQVVTNGLLLMQMPDSFFEILKRCGNHSGISISFYPVMEKKMDAVREFLRQKEIPYEISEMAVNFRKEQSLEPNDDAATMSKFSHCYQKGCHNLYDGKIATCFLPFTTKYFNAYFHKKLPEDGAIDLYREELTTAELRRAFTAPFERCRYCREPVEVPWHQIHNPSILEDWV